MRAAVPVARVAAACRPGSIMRFRLASRERRLARLVLLRLLGELLLLGLLLGRRAGARARPRRASVSSRRCGLGLLRLVGASSRALLLRLGLSSAPRAARPRRFFAAARAWPARSRSARRRCGGATGAGLATGAAAAAAAGLGLGCTRRRLRARAAAASAAARPTCGTADQSSATTPSGSLAFQLHAEGERHDQQHMDEQRQHQPASACPAAGAARTASRARARRLLIAGRSTPQLPRWLFTDRPTRWTPARCSASITFTTASYLTLLSAEMTTGVVGVAGLGLEHARGRRRRARSGAGVLAVDAQAQLLVGADDELDDVLRRRCRALADARQVDDAGRDQRRGDHEDDQQHQHHVDERDHVDLVDRAAARAAVGDGGHGVALSAGQARASSPAPASRRRCAAGCSRTPR